MADQEALFVEPGVADDVPESRIAFLAGEISQVAWGDGRRSAAQRQAALEAARAAVERLRLFRS